MKLVVCGQLLFACSSLRKPSSADGKMLFLGIYMRSEEYQGDQPLICSRVKDPCQCLAFPGIVSRNRCVPHCLGSPFPQAGSSPAPQPSLLLTTAQLTPIQAADTYFQGVSELRYL